MNDIAKEMRKIIKNSNKNNIVYSNEIELFVKNKLEIALKEAIDEKIHDNILLNIINHDMFKLVQNDSKKNLLTFSNYIKSLIYYVLIKYYNFKENEIIISSDMINYEINVAHIFITFCEEKEGE